MTIDSHTHVVPGVFPEYAGSEKEHRWPSMEHTGPGKATVMIAGKPFRQLTDLSWDVARRLEVMQEEGVEMQVLSPMPELFSYWFNEEDGVAISEVMNRQIGDMVAAEPKHFVGLGIVPAQFPEIAAKVMARLRPDYGLVGIEIGSNVNGKSIGDTFFEPIFAAAVEHDLALFIHAFHPTDMDRVIGPPIVGALAQFPNETAIAAASIITGGVLDRHPDIRIGFGHGGGSFGLVLPRMVMGWELTKSMGQAYVEKSPAEYAKMMYYDSCVFDQRALKYLIDVFGADKIMVGTDAPFIIRQQNPGTPIKELGLSGKDTQAILEENCKRFLKI